MTYEEFYQMVEETFDHSIQTEDEISRKKVRAMLQSWYMRVYDEKAQKLCSTDEETGLIAIALDIKRICKLSDAEKIKATYEDSAFLAFQNLSREIFNKALDLSNHKIDKIGSATYEMYNRQLEEYENKIAPIFKEDYMFLKSESILDLQYLKEKDGVKNYSFRLGKYLSSNKHHF